MKSTTRSTRSTDTKAVADENAGAEDASKDESKVEAKVEKNLEKADSGPFEFNHTDVLAKLLGGTDTETQAVISVWLSEGRTLVDLMKPEDVMEIKGTAQFKAIVPAS